MFLRILKKDIMRKKSMNTILLIFIILSTTFLSSSINNLYSIQGSINYFIEKSKAPDLIIPAVDKGNNKEMEAWLEQSKNIKEYDIDESILLTNQNLKINRNNKTEDYKAFGDILIQPQTEKLGKILDMDGEEIKLKKGEIAFCIADRVNNNLEIGEKIIVEIEGVKKELTVKEFTKDSLYGSSMSEMKRVVISKEDYTELKDNTKKKAIFKNYYINTDNIDELKKELKNVDISYITLLEKDVLETTFILDMLPSIILILVSLCLIVISFLILRFTIVFTIQDDFKEIGIMKAIGLRNFNIKKIYLIKYLVISLIGAAIGGVISIPFGNTLLEKSAEAMLMRPNINGGMFNVVCGALVVLLINIFCYTSTRKLNKISPITAIRNGSNGESFSGKGRLKLSKSFIKSTPLFLALNDNLSNFKRYVVLILTFCIGTLLIILPINAINTMKDGNIIKLFSLQYSDVLIEPDNNLYVSDYSEEDYINHMKNIEKNLISKGIDVKLYSELSYNATIFNENQAEETNIYILQSVGNEKNEYSILKGEMPKEINEIAITESLAKKYKVNIGDTINLKIGKEKKGFIITGLYESMVNMGKSARINTKIKIDFNNMAFAQPLQGDFKNQENSEELIKKIKEIYPDYTVTTSSEFVSRYVGSSVEQLDGIKNMLVLIVVLINSLITMLMMKIFISKEKGEISMVKSIGFRNSSVRLWQSITIISVLVIGIVLGIILAIVVGPSLVGQIFKLMGVSTVDLKIIPFEVYIMYPGALLLINSIVAYVTSSKVKKIDFKEINSME